MGNVFSVSFSCDDTVSPCLDCSVRKAGYVIEVRDNIDALQRELNKLIDARNDIRIRVILDEQQHKKQLAQVRGWLSTVQDVENEAGKLLQSSGEEVQKLRLGGFYSKNYKSSYKFGKQVFKTLRVVGKLRKEGDFKDVAQIVPENPVDERPIPETVVGLQATFDKVWRCLTEEKAGIIGIYGMGGVGKTTLLTQINNELLYTPNNFDVVIWAVASKDLQLQNIQKSIAKKIGLFDESWKSKSLPEKAQEIFKILSRKKYLLLLDDIWEEVDLTKVGLPVPSSRSASHVIFTTREFKVCGDMEAHKRFKVDCLGYEDAWRLFEEKVGRDILDSHPNIRELAETVVKECGGLPLALIIVGRAMSCMTTPREWEHAIEVLKSSASNFSGMEAKVYSRLKLSYDFLSSDRVRLCLLYCSLFPEDFQIEKENLIDFWICEEFLDEYDGIRARNHGYSIISNLVRACLLEEVENDRVKMHDVIRDMALWIASTIEREKETFLALAGVGLTEPPRIGMWKDATRISLMNNKIQSLLESPTCPGLRTLFLSGNGMRVVRSDFFQSMTSLRILDLSFNSKLKQLPDRLSGLTSLQHLDLSHTGIERLPEELKYLVNLICLNLQTMLSLRSLQPQLISRLKKLRILNMYRCGRSEQEEDSILFGGGELLLEELHGLKHLNVLTIGITSFHAFQMLLSSPGLQSSTRHLLLRNLDDSKSLSLASLARLRHLDVLHLWQCRYLAELEIDLRETHCFRSLHSVKIGCCSKLRHLTWLIFAPNLKGLSIFECEDMEEIIKWDEVSAENLKPFAFLENLALHGLQNLKSIYPSALPFPHLKELRVRTCPKLKRIPLDCSSASERKFTIWGEDSWWTQLQWDDQATQNAFRPCFKSTTRDSQ